MAMDLDVNSKDDLKEKYKSHCVAFVAAFIIMTYLGFFYVTEGGHPLITDNVIFMLGALFALVALYNSQKYRRCI